MNRGKQARDRLFARRDPLLKIISAPVGGPNKGVRKDEKKELSL